MNEIQKWFLMEKKQHKLLINILNEGGVDVIWFEMFVQHSVELNCMKLLHRNFISKQDKQDTGCICVFDGLQIQLDEPMPLAANIFLSRNLDPDALVNICSSRSRGYYCQH